MLSKLSQNTKIIISLIIGTSIGIGIGYVLGKNKNTQFISNKKSDIIHTNHKNKFLFYNLDLETIIEIDEDSDNEDSDNEE